MRKYLHIVSYALAAWLLVGALILPSQAMAASSSTGYTQTRYPIVLVHGLFGFGQLFGSVDYWYGIPDGLQQGGAKVYVADLSAVNDETVRGNQLIAELENLQALYGYTKFNLVGHSQGGFTVRYVAAVRPDLVASATTVGTPHAGTPVADAVVAALPPGSPLRTLVAGFVNALGALIGDLSNDPNAPQDAIAAANLLSTAGAAQFNVQFPNGMPATSCGSGAGSVNGIRFYSMGGTSVLTNVLDPSDAVMLAGSLFFGNGASDGLVGQCSNHFGTVLRDNYGWNHLDEVNQVFGLRGLFSSDPVQVYRDQANRLKNAGL